jgi:FKBP-type peptidyl-prolyl cis-trans isomerase SlyD
MTASLAAATDRVVTIHYTLTIGNGQIIDQSGDEPMAYLHGHENIVPGLERQLEGKVAGDKLKAVVAAEDGYGEKLPDALHTVPRSALPSDEEIEVGMQFVMEDKSGEVAMMWVAEVQPTSVVFDLNHPLAGQTLNFDVQVLEVRQATAEELAHGHVHGPHGHHHH